jgi:hypothetical protein
MRIVAAIFALLSLALLSAGAVDASGSKKVKRSQSSPAPASRAQSRNPMAENGYVGYYERVENRVPFGSKLWWDVYSSMPRGG